MKNDKYYFTDEQIALLYTWLKEDDWKPTIRYDDKVFTTKIIKDTFRGIVEQNISTYGDEDKELFNELRDDWIKYISQ